jgi:hypothetical protein
MSPADVVDVVDVVGMALMAEKHSIYRRKLTGLQGRVSEYSNRLSSSNRKGYVSGREKRIRQKVDVVDMKNRIGRDNVCNTKSHIGRYEDS